MVANPEFSSGSHTHTGFCLTQQTRIQNLIFFSVFNYYMGQQIDLVLSGCCWSVCLLVDYMIFNSIRSIVDHYFFFLVIKDWISFWLNENNNKKNECDEFLIKKIVIKMIIVCNTHTHTHRETEITKPKIIEPWWIMRYIFINDEYWCWINELIKRKQK